MERQERGELTTADLASASESTDEERRGDSGATSAPPPPAGTTSEGARTDAQSDTTGEGQQQMETARAEEPTGPLFPSEELTQLRRRWEETQASFVDQPRQSVEQADALVAEVMKRLADSFASARADLEKQWARGDDVSTEDLRVAFTRYRSFFERLLTA
jgi:hypothetical protein